MTGSIETTIDVALAKIRQSITTALDGFSEMAKAEVIRMCNDYGFVHPKAQQRCVYLVVSAMMIRVLAEVNGSAAKALGLLDDVTGSKH